MSILRTLLLTFLLVATGGLYAEQGMVAIEQAAKENKHLFIFFFKDQNERTLRSQKIFDQGAQKMGNQAHFIKIKVNDPTESEIVKKFNLKRTPMPFLLVLAPNGAVTGGYSSNFTEKHLLDSLTSPGMAKCLKALQDRKLVFLCFQNKNTLHNQAALQGVQDFKNDGRFSSATEVILIDPSDKQEEPFIKQLALSPPFSQAKTVFISPPAETIGQYEGATTKEQFVSALKQAASGCCPGGCCPGGCCPGGKCK